jgi:8-oxo-dGTP pyrophosphatase MutT (NUDIX family)
MPASRRVTTLDLVIDDWSWPFARQRRDAIDTHFATLCAANPALWNGRVLLAREPRFDGATFSARYFETDFASFIAWRDWGFPDASVVNAPGAGALRGNDGGFVLGEMAPHTANAGRIYFPSGTPDLSDIKEGRVDIAGSVAREVAEETGLTPAQYIAEPEWQCISTAGMISLIRILDVPCPADELRSRIEANLRTQATPELCAIHIIRSRDDITPAMPAFVATFIAAHDNHATRRHLAPVPTKG